MPDRLPKAFRFWYELKRRKVVRVITVYAASAFVLMELVDIISEPFGLPDWTLKLVIVLLVIGLIVSVILSWVYDFNPEGGWEKTGKNEIQGQQAVKSSSLGWKIATYISLAIILGLVLVQVFFGNGIPQKGNKLDKSIAVLPFRNDSPDEAKMYFINGTMESILDNLSRIEDLRVISRTSVEQYRNSTLSLPEIAGEMNVSYILEGSGLKDGENVRLTVQLIEAKNDRHLWSKTYHRKSAEIFELQAEIAELIADEIESVVTPEERERIEKIPTTSLTAYDFYQKGREEFGKYFDNENTKYLERAKELYEKAIHFDSTYAEAYFGLAAIYWNSNYLKEYQSEGFLDSVMILSDKALYYNDELDQAYSLRGVYYAVHNQHEKAMKEFDKALDLNPNSSMAYEALGNMFYMFLGEPDEALKNFHKAIGLRSGDNLSHMLRYIIQLYAEMGFKEIAQGYMEQALELSRDSSEYFLQLSSIYGSENDYEKALKYLKRASDQSGDDSNNLFNYIWINWNLGNNEDALQYSDHYLADREQSRDLPSTFELVLLGDVFLQNKDQDQADLFFNRATEVYQDLKDLGRLSYIDHYAMACIYARQNKLAEALEYLEACKNSRDIYGSGLDIAEVSFFINLAKDPEFQRIIQEIEDKYQADRESIAQWLEENDMLIL